MVRCRRVTREPCLPITDTVSPFHRPLPSPLAARLRLELMTRMMRVVVEEFNGAVRIDCFDGTSNPFRSAESTDAPEKPLFYCLTHPHTDHLRGESPPSRSWSTQRAAN